MHVQIVTFRLDGLDTTAYLAMCDAVAPLYDTLDGCLGKLFVRDPDHPSRFGGVYLWDTREQADAYARTGVLAELVGRPDVTDVDIRVLEVLAEPTAVSAGALMALVRG